MTKRTIEAIIPPSQPHFVGDGFRVHNFIPGAYQLDRHRMDPFIMLDYGSKHVFEPSAKQRGVGVHPHRGFETVTIAYKGSIAHHDSAGGGGIISEGDVQWMTAGSGVLHKEYHEEEFSKKGGAFQMVQLWVNLAAKNKMTPPKYQAIKNADIAKVPLQEGKGEIEIIAGKYNDTQGAATTFSPVHLYNLCLPTNASTTLSFPQHYNTALLVIEGSITVNDEAAATDHFVLMSNDGTTFSLTANEQALVLVLSGEPLCEPIAAHGPFVMNTQEEILQAFKDYNLCKFGYL